MAAKFMKVKRVVLSLLTVAILTSQLCGCAVIQKNDLLDMIEDGETVTIELSVPNWSSESAKQLSDLSWVELDQLKTYTTTGFRLAVDQLFFINTVTTQNGNTKQGCMYTINDDSKDIQSGNTTMRDAFRNKAFDSYWNTDSIQNSLAEAVEFAYTDIDRNSQYASMAAINAYFNIFNDGDNDTSYGATQSLTREQFYTLVFKAANGVQDLGYSGDSDAFSILTGTNNYYTPYAKQLADKGYLSISNGSLNATNISTPISKLEALYLVVNTYFNKEVSKIELSGKESAFGYRNAGDQISKLEINGEEASEAVENNLLAYLVDTQGEKGIDQTIMPYIMVAEKLGLMNGISSRNDLFTSITKDETLRLLANTYQAENKLYGYLTTAEYGEMSTIDGSGIVVDNTDKSEQSNKDYSDYIPIFESIYESCYRDTVADEVNFEVEQTLIEVRVENRELPSNGLDLYIEWRLTNHPLATKGQDQTAEDIYQAVNETVYTTGSANIRSGASTNDSIIKTASKGTSMTRTGIGSNGWSRVEFNGQTCYVSSDLLSTTKPSSGSGSGSSGGGSSQSKPQSGSQSGSGSQSSSIDQGGSDSSRVCPTIPGANVINNDIDDGLTPEERSERVRNGGSQGYTGEEFGGG